VFVFLPKALLLLMYLLIQASMIEATTTASLSIQLNRRNAFANVLKPDSCL